MKRVLCFTTSYLRPKMLRGCILDIQNQSHKNIFHTINIAYDNGNKTFIDGHMECSEYRDVYDDLSREKLSIVYNMNEHQQINYTNALKSVNIDDFDLFVKIDDDDIYKRNYVKNIVEFFSKTDVDIVSSEISRQLNGFLVIRNIHHDLGGNPKGSNFKMPMTFAFNRKALDLVMDIPKHYAFEDEMWRDIWVKNKLKHKIINNRDEVIWNVHGNNVSTSNLLVGVEPEKEYTIQITPLTPPK